jgi:fatty acid desaturase
LVGSNISAGSETNRAASHDSDDHSSKRERDHPHIIASLRSNATADTRRFPDCLDAAITQGRPAMVTQLKWKMVGRRYSRYKFDLSIRRQIAGLQPDNWHGLVALTCDYAIIGACVYMCLAVSWWLYPIALLVIGARQRGLSTVLHDSAHGVCARNRALNKILGTWLTAYPIFQRHYAYRSSHVQRHHPCLGDPVRDPDLRFFIEEGAYTVCEPRRYFFRIVLWPLIGSRTVAYLRYLFRNRYKHLAHPGPTPIRWHRDRRTTIDNVSFLAFWCAVISVVIYNGTWLDLFAFWLLPYLTSFHILGWFIELSEHTPLMARESVDLYMTRNRKSTGLEKFLTGVHNDNYHLDHHLDPRTPFWHLPLAHAIRMRDKKYAALDRDTGGLFTKSRSGAPSALSRILETHAALRRASASAC